ncbi:MAG: hypothetical protein CVU00_11435 [Bacteroidetes bacterium HGW-Bacteroidetes-17]|jgi:hypothetical protein|nr:MAG: hypothetical protein CVU00_11435 [Bacteroidetes bacterium HGW-Bacteroidetes-17]
MKRIVTLAFLFLYLSNGYANSKLIDMSGVNYFWRIIGKLEKDIQPSEEEWKAMFNCIGYKSLRNDKDIRYNIELVFSPSKKEKLDASLEKANYWWQRDLLHLIKVKEEQIDLKKFQQEINVDKILKDALELAETYLPKGTTKKNPPPPIQFVIFSPDARAMGGNIIFDLKFTKDIGETLLIKTLAHEAHHHYCNFLPKTIDPPSENSPYDPIYSTLRQLQLEGIADLLDKKEYITYQKKDTSSGFVKMWDEAKSLQSQKMKTLDSMLTQMAEDTTGMYETGMKAFRMFPINCHPNGNYMAELILKHYGKKAIIKTMNNPFAFFRLYHDVCIKEEDEYVLSDEAMVFLERLEKMSTINNK